MMSAREELLDALRAEKLLDDDKSGPRWAVMQSLNMLVCTEGKERTVAEYTALLREAGFDRVEGRRTDSPLDAVLAAIEMRNIMREYAAKSSGVTFDLRIGIHTGPVVAGVVGTRRFAYDIWGETVNLRHRRARQDAASSEGHRARGGNQHSAARQRRGHLGL